VNLADQLRDDVAQAMKAGDRERASALRLVLSEIQKAAKDGHDDERAVLRRERKRRLDAAEQYTSASRPELARQEESEARLIEGYLPAELGDDELRRLVAEAVERSGASSARDMGRVMKEVMGPVAGRADGKRVSALVREELGA
jgi:uncharacterized protein YqeY